MLLTVIGLAVIFGIADRFAGGGLGWEKLGKDNGGPLSGRPLYYAAPLSMIACGLLFMNPLAALIAVPWIVWRSPGWKLWFGGVIDPGDSKEIKATFLRHMLIAPLFVLAFLLGYVPGLVLLATILWAAFATYLGTRLYKAYINGHDFNPQTEVMRGVGYGALIGLALGKTFLA